ncbi:hypothetical protein SLEP1_g45838 [Rubroshorea leprosula]|uniref:Uncharacterized protein n=1 Tax=Rubroshorea leprosula TaxID=152421 RepID=A0AAV5LKC6_9ROSI|nr:hypothetical protein SLEP1_g45838 [Rubroshorea leprosula]
MEEREKLFEAKAKFKLPLGHLQLKTMHGSTNNATKCNPPRNKVLSMNEMVLMVVCSC